MSTKGPNLAESKQKLRIQMEFLEYQIGDSDLAHDRREYWSAKVGPPKLELSHKEFIELVDWGAAGSCKQSADVVLRELLWEKVESPINEKLRSHGQQPTPKSFSDRLDQIADKHAMAFFELSVRWSPNEELSIPTIKEANRHIPSHLTLCTHLANVVRQLEVATIDKSTRDSLRQLVESALRHANTLLYPKSPTLEGRTREAADKLLGDICAAIDELEPQPGVEYPRDKPASKVVEKFAKSFGLKIAKAGSLGRKLRRRKALKG